MRRPSRAQVLAIAAFLWCALPAVWVVSAGAWLLAVPGALGTIGSLSVISALQRGAVGVARATAYTLLGVGLLTVLYGGLTLLPAAGLLLAAAGQASRADTDVRAVSDSGRRIRGVVAFTLTVIAFGCGLAALGLAVADGGPGPVLLLVAIPALAAGVVWFALHDLCSTGAEMSEIFVPFAISLLIAYLFSTGAWVYFPFLGAIPVLLLVAWLVTPRPGAGLPLAH